MALLSTQQVGIPGAAVPAFATCAASDTVVPDDRSFLEWRNTSATVNNVVVVVPGTVYGQARPDVSFAVAATTGTYRFGPLAGDLADPTTGLITITHSNTGAGSGVQLVRI